MDYDELKFTSMQTRNRWYYTLTESANQIATESQGVEDVANSVSDSALAINDELSKFKIESDNQ